MHNNADILVIGATGFIGRRLVPALLKEGFTVRCLSRKKKHSGPAGAENREGDLLRPETLPETLKGIDTAYYLAHSMGEHGRFSDKERQSAVNFVEAAENAGIRRVIYLSGLGDENKKLSEHLTSRREVARILGQAAFKTTILRSGVILGEGGASYEMIRFLVRTSFALPDREWLHARCQPIAVDDVIRYLVGCLQNEETAGETFDIGGPEVMTYYDLIEAFAAEMNTHHINAPVPFFMPGILAKWVGAMTPVNAGLAIALLKGIHHDVVCQENRIRELVPFELTPCRKAIRRALDEREQRLEKERQTPRHFQV